MGQLPPKKEKQLCRKIAGEINVAKETKEGKEDNGAKATKKKKKKKKKAKKDVLNKYISPKSSRGGSPTSQVGSQVGDPVFQRMSRRRSIF